jgi:predicted SAM-dependent methyltransferase
MSFKKSLYNVFPFIPKVNLFIGQKLYPTRLRLRRKSVIESLKNKAGLYVNVGCGSMGVAEGWVNIDYGQYTNVTHTFDCRTELPLENNSAKGIYNEHFFEHLDYVTEVPFFLAECYRSLAKDGVLRIVVPDAGKYLLGYAAEGWDMLKQTRPLDDNFLDLLMGCTYQTKMQLINEVFRQSGEHKYAWDFETLKLILMTAGFAEVKQMSYLHSHDPKLAIDQHIRQPESLYVEAIK